MSNAPPEVLAAWQNAAEARLSYLEEMLVDGESDLPPVETDEPYCGCQTCQIREVINAIVLVTENWRQPAKTKLGTEPEWRAL